MSERIMNNSNETEIKITPRRIPSPSGPTMRAYSGPPLNSGYVKKSVNANNAVTHKGNEGFFVRVLEGIITFSFAALFFGVPIFFTGATFQGIVFEKYMYFFFFLLIGLVAWVSKSVVSGEMKIRRTPIDFPLLIFWFAILLSTVFSIDRWHSFFGQFGDLSRGFLSITAFVLFYYLLLSHFTMARFRWMFSALVVSGSLVIVWSLLAVMNIRFLPSVVLPYAPLSLFESMSSLGLFLGMMFSILLTAIVKLSDQSEASLARRLTALLLLILTIADVAAIFILFGFISWTPIFAGISIFLLYILARIVKISGRWEFAPMLVFVAILAIFMIGQKPLARVTLQSEATPNMGLSWEIALAGIKENPFIGSGIGTYGHVFSQYRPQSFNADPLYTLEFKQGSNMLFELLPTVGVFGSIAFMFVSLSFVSVGLYLLSREKEKNKLTSLGVWSASFTFLVALFSAPMNGSALLAGVIISCLAMAVLLEESQAEKRSMLSFSLSASPQYALSIAFLFIVVSAGVVFLFISLGKILVADTYAGSALRAKEVKEDGSIRHLLSAIGIYPREGTYYVRLAQEYMALANSEALKNQKDGERNEDMIRTYLQNSLIAARAGRDLLPKDIEAQVAVAQIYDNAALFVADAPEKAEEEYAKASALEPTNPVYHLKIGQVILAKARSKEKEEEKKAIIEKARESFQKSVDLKEDFAPGIYYLSVVKEATGDVSGALDEMLKAVRYEPQSGDYLYNLGRLYQLRGEGTDNENAEKIYRTILAADEKNIYVHSSLALLYDKNKDKEKALEQYQKVLDLLPTEGSDNIRKNIGTMMENVRNGVSNEQQILSQQNENTSPVPEETVNELPQE